MIPTSSARTRLASARPFASTSRRKASATSALALLPAKTTSGIPARRTRLASTRTGSRSSSVDLDRLRLRLTKSLAKIGKR